MLLKTQQSGFTLIEIMVVVVILAILATIVVPRVMDRPDQARITKARNDIQAIESALNLFKLDNFNYPTTEQGLEALVKQSGNQQVENWKQGGYLDKLPVDPWGKPYFYLNPGVHSTIDIFTYGADKKEGGKGSDEDIGNWIIQ